MNLVDWTIVACVLMVIVSALLAGEAGWRPVSPVHPFHFGHPRGA